MNKIEPAFPISNAFWLKPITDREYLNKRKADIGSVLLPEVQI